MTSTVSSLLRQALQVIVNGATLVAPQAISVKGNAWFNGKFEVPLNDTDASPDALLSFPVEFDGEPLKASSTGIHQSQPRKFSAKAKAVISGKVKLGDDIPGTGGNWTVTYAAARTIDDHDFMVKVVATIVNRKATKALPERRVIVVVVQAIPIVKREAKPFEQVGSIVGELSFG